MPYFSVPYFLQEVNNNLGGDFVVEVIWRWGEEDQKDGFYLKCDPSKVTERQVIDAVRQFYDDNRLPDGSMPIPDVWR